MSKSWAYSALLMSGLLASGCSWLNAKLMYVPMREHAIPTPGNVQEVMIGPVHAWYFAGDPVVLLCHGNGGNISHRLEKLRLIKRAGAGALIFDYRGYGKSEGTPSEKHTYEDGEAAYRWLASTTTARIVLYGESLGGGVATELATRVPAAGLVLDSAFTSALDMGKRIFPWLPVRLLVRYKYDNLAKIAAVKMPVLVMHSPQDEIIPYDMGRRLFEAAPGKKAFVEMRGGHNDGFYLSRDAYVDGLKSFFAAL